MGYLMTNRWSSRSNIEDVGRAKRLEMADYRLEYFCCRVGSLTSRYSGVPGSFVVCYFMRYGTLRISFVHSVHSALLLVDK